MVSFEGKNRTVVIGGPRVGKTTLAASLACELGIVARSTDSIIGIVSYDDAPREVATWFTEFGPWLVEGVTAVRALRLWLQEHDEGVPCERVFWSDAPKVEQTRGQRTMAKGCGTVWSQIESELLARGVSVQRF